MTEEQGPRRWTSDASYWAAWLHPAAVLALLAIGGSGYAAVLLQAARIARLEERLTVVEQQYQRQDVTRVQLDAILQRLGAIEQAVTERRP